MREMRQQEMQKLKALGTAPSAAGQIPSPASSAEANDDFDEVEEDPEGIGDKGFANFTRSLVVIYLCQWLNEKPEQTNFCKLQMPVKAQSDSLAAAVGSITSAEYSNIGE